MPLTKVHLVDDAQVIAVRPELDGATPIVPLRAVALRLAVQTTDEWPLPFLSEELCVAVHPELAMEIAYALLAAARELESK